MVHSNISPIGNKFLLGLLLMMLLPFFLVSQVPEKASPFTAVKWEGDQPVVRFEGAWYPLISIDAIETPNIVDFCKETYGDRWQKRFSEDLVEVMNSMGHPLEVSIDLVLLQEGKPISRSGIMTEDNRDAVRDYNNSSEEEATSNSKIAVSSGKSTSISSEERMARQMAEWVDMVWEQDPEENTANLRFLFSKNGQVFSGKIDIHGDFSFRAVSVRTYIQAFNPNQNGRWVYEELPPGSYNLYITGSNDFEGWSWSKENVEVKPDTKPLFEISLD